jgi:hypothetical protein
MRMGVLIMRFVIAHLSYLLLIASFLLEHAILVDYKFISDRKIFGRMRRGNSAPIR